MYATDATYLLLFFDRLHSICRLIIRVNDHDAMQARCNVTFRDTLWLHLVRLGGFSMTLFIPAYLPHPNPKNVTPQRRDCSDSLRER